MIGLPKRSVVLNIANKIKRLRRGMRPRVLDLFAGCGGLSLGFQRAGFRIVGGVEIDPDAARSYGLNFHRGHDTHAVPRDIAKTSPESLVRALGLGDPAAAIDVIVGGPPCQAFARVGRPKLREVFDHPHAFRKDARARLYIEYLHYVKVLQPLAILMENVPDVLNHAGHNIAEEICDLLETLGFDCGYTLLNAALYGVPQMRERMFLIAYRRELGAKVSFPMPLNAFDLPAGYQGSRAFALKHMNGLARTASHYVDPPAMRRQAPGAVTAEEALGDLPPIYARRADKPKRGARSRGELVPWKTSRKPSEYALLMRTWPGHAASSDGVRDHVIRYLPRDYAIFARMRPGDQYPEALAIAEARFVEALLDLAEEDSTPRKGSRPWRRLKREIIPPYDAEKFPNKWRKMGRSEPARTLMAHLGKDSYSHIHYDGSQARTISVREAARLQSFPDGFVFSGTMNMAFQQIGNAVPPLMAATLASVMLAALRQGRVKSSINKKGGARPSDVKRLRSTRGRRSQPRTAPAEYEAHPRP